MKISFGKAAAFTMGILLLFSFFPILNQSSLINHADATWGGSYPYNGWGSWTDTSACVANSCGTTAGTKTQISTCTTVWSRGENVCSLGREVCDKICPTVQFSASHRIYAEDSVEYGPWSNWSSCLSNNTCSSSDRNAGICEDSDSGCFYNKDKKRTRTIAHVCPAGYTYAEKPGNDDCYKDESFGPITFTYDKVENPVSSCHRPTGSSLGVPSWAMSDYNSDNPEWKYPIDVNCHQEPAQSQTQTVACVAESTPCPINGGWSDWSVCSATCGEGIQTRTCTEPEPANDGADCSELDGGNASRSCQMPACPATYPTYESLNSCPSNKPIKTSIGSYGIASNDADGEAISLTSGGYYYAQVTGTFVPTSAANWFADAGYSTNNNWQNVLPDYGITGTDPNKGAHALLGDLGSGVGIINWGAYNSDHVYEFYFSPTAANTQFVIGDRWSNWYNTEWNNQTGMSDNSGSLNLNIYECQADTTGPVVSIGNGNGNDPANAGPVHESIVSGAINVYATVQDNNLSGYHFRIVKGASPVQGHPCGDSLGAPENQGYGKCGYAYNWVVNGNTSFVNNLIGSIDTNQLGGNGNYWLVIGAIDSFGNRTAADWTADPAVEVVVNNIVFPPAGICPNTCGYEGGTVPNGQGGDIICPVTDPCAPAETCPIICGYAGGTVPDGEGGSLTCEATSACPVEEFCPLTCGYAGGVVADGQGGNKTCPATNPCAPAETCPTTCGYAGGTVPNGEGGTIACAATDPCPLLTTSGGGGTCSYWQSDCNLGPTPTATPQVLGASATPTPTPTPTGKVLGESIACGAYLDDYLWYGKKNDSEQVKKLQQFLNSELGATLPITGFFGLLTHASVTAFQEKYASEILQPWLDKGLMVEKKGTGNVYKTTKWKINMMMCSDLNLDPPELP